MVGLSWEMLVACYRKNSLIDESVRCFEEDDEKVWIGTDNGISVFNKHSFTFKNYHILDKPNPGETEMVLCIHKDKNNVKWIGTYGLGLYIFNEINSGFDPI